jgi:hypothetical protein
VYLILHDTVKPVILHSSTDCKKVWTFQRFQQKVYFLIKNDTATYVDVFTRLSSPYQSTKASWRSSLFQKHIQSRLVRVSQLTANKSWHKLRFQFKNFQKLQKLQFFSRFLTSEQRECEYFAGGNLVTLLNSGVYCEELAVCKFRR